MPRNYFWKAPEGAGIIKVIVKYEPHANSINIVETANLKLAIIPAYEFPEIIKAGRTLAHSDMHTILLRRKG